MNTTPEEGRATASPLEAAPAPATPVETLPKVAPVEVAALKDGAATAVKDGEKV